MQEVTGCLEDEKSISEGATYDVDLKRFLKVLGCLQMKVGPYETNGNACFFLNALIFKCLNALKVKALFVMPEMVIQLQ